MYVNKKLVLICSGSKLIWFCPAGQSGSNFCTRKYLNVGRSVQFNCTLFGFDMFNLMLP